MVLDFPLKIKPCYISALKYPNLPELKKNTDVKAVKKLIHWLQILWKQNSQLHFPNIPLSLKKIFKNPEKLMHKIFWVQILVKLPIFQYNKSFPWNYIITANTLPKQQTDRNCWLYWFVHLLRKLKNCFNLL